MDELEDGYACGLDLGTTFSCLGVFKNGGVEIIPNRNGDKITPSIVTILDGKILKGEETLDYLVKNYDTSIYAIKRFIGRDYNDPKVKEEINKENFPFKITENSETKHLVVEINQNGEIIDFNLEEISSFVISKMVENAEEFLKRKIKKLVITVPANFNDSQRKCTKQAAELAGVEVIRIINEPTAAALAYGLQNKDNNNNGKILVFDLGGGTFDVTILDIIKNKNNDEKIFEILSTSGDKFLGGEDFDNKIVEYVLNEFCVDNNLSKEEIMKDKKAIKRLKISCENIKKILSYNDDEISLCLNHFYKDKDILKKLTRLQLELLFESLFERIKNLLYEALIDAKLNTNDITEIILVGGSTRIPHIKVLLKKYFPQSKINDSINPDEAVAYGATLMAAKIMKKRDSFVSTFNLMDITPFSLGTNIVNKSKNKEIKKEGDLMSVIIKRGTKIPINNTQEYFTVSNNQKSVSINIYEGEEKYVKYNHLLKEASLDLISQKPAGKVKITVNFFIDVNGILTVTGTEQDLVEGKNNFIKNKIKNDGIGLTKEEIEQLIKKNIKYLKKMKMNEDSEYNIKETLKEYQDAYKEAEKTNDEESKFNILMGNNVFLEEFINKFDKNFDNEIVIEKYYLYIKDLFISYVKVFNIKGKLDKGEQINIIKNIKEYTEIFISLSSGYLSNLMDILKDLPKKVLYEIVVFIMGKFNEYGKKCLLERKKFSRYSSIIYFEKANNFFKYYINNIKELLKAGCDIKIQKDCRHQVQISEGYLTDINSKIILLCEDALREQRLISSKSGWTNFRKVIIYNKEDKEQQNEDEKEKFKIVLDGYEKMLPEYEGKGNIEEALILANIIKISYKLLSYSNYRLYKKWGDRCIFIATRLNIDPKTEWYSEFCEIYNEIKNNYQEISDEEMKEIIKEKYKKKFDEIDEIFKNRKSTKDFIDIILKKIPYKGYLNDFNNNLIDFSKVDQELLFYLTTKYQINEYTYSPDSEESQLNYCLIEYVDSLINRLYKRVD